MTDLADFLLARIADDEAKVEEFRARWGDAPMRVVPSYMLPTRMWVSDEYSQLIVEPARVLAECEAKRLIVDLHSGAAPACAWTQDSSTTHDDEGEDTCDTMRALALPYAGHPDYREEWRP